MQKDLDKLSNQSRFIKMIIDGSLVVARKKKKDLVTELKKLNFKPFPKIADARKEGEFENVVERDEESEESEEVAAGANDYDYLLGMAIWSLTQERVDKLLKQIGDKEVEIDTLIKLTPKDLWTKDLDDFMHEWYIQLDDEKKRAKKYASMGRRASAKLGIEGKAGKRKKGADDDSDFEVARKKPKPKTNNSLTDFFNKYTEPIAAKPKTAQATLGAKKESPMVLDGASDTMEDVAPKKATAAFKMDKVPAPKPVVKPAAKPKKAPKPASDDEDEDVFAEIAKEEAKKPKASAPPARAARNATKKPVKYDLSSEDSDSDGNDMLGDVSTMVKGIGGSSNEATATRALFSASAQRPGSSHGLSVKAKERFSTHRIVDISDDDVDMTDYTKLVPQGSPQRPAARTANDTILSEDEDSLDMAITKPKAKPVARTNKAAAKPAAKKAAPAPAPKNPTALSPAAKAYAAKQAKAAAASKTATKKTIDSDDHEANDLVNDLLSDGGSPAPGPAKQPASAPAARRPGRAAATKSKYVVSDDESGSESEASFEEDDDDSFD